MEEGVDGIMDCASMRGGWLILGLGWHVAAVMGDRSALGN